MSDRPRKITLRVSGTRVGDPARPADSTLAVRPVGRFGLRTNQTRLRPAQGSDTNRTTTAALVPHPDIPQVEVVTDDDEVAS